MKKLHSFKKALLAITVSAAATFSATAVLAAGQESGAVESPPVLKAKRCYSCHAVDKNLIGPPYQAIAAIHAANKEVMRDVLVQKIIHGGGSNWGLVPMVPNPHVTQEEAREMVDWILTLQAN